MSWQSTVTWVQQGKRHLNMHLKNHQQHSFDPFDLSYSIPAMIHSLYREVYGLIREAMASVPLPIGLEHSLGHWRPYGSLLFSF